MASEQIQQVLIASEPAPLNLAASSGRTPSNTGLSYAGLPCANPEFKGDITIAENNTVANKFFNRPGRPTLRRGSVAFDLYLRSTGASGTFEDAQFNVLHACFGKVSESHAQYDVFSWLSTTTMQILDTSGLAPGQGFAFTTTDGVKHVRFIQSVSAGVVTFYPAMTAEIYAALPSDTDAIIRGGRTYAMGRNYAENSSLAAQLRKEAYMVECFGLQGSTFELPLQTGEMATAKVTLAAGYYNPVAAALDVNATDEPPGTWLKFLNADAYINDASRAVHSCKWNVNFQPKAKKTPANAAGLVAWEMGKPEVTCTIELSEFDSDFPGFMDNGTEFPVLAYMGTTSGGSAVAIYAPRMHLTKYPEPVAIDDLTGLPLELRIGNYEGDSGSYSTDEESLSNTVLRLFFEGGITESIGGP